MTGTMNSESTRENITPPTITRPSGLRLVEAAPRERAMGSAPNIMAMLVISMGRRRRVAASMAALSVVSPFSRRLLAYSTIRMPFLVTRPTSMMIPICEKIFSVSTPAEKAIAA